jgi:hypothetical protein
MAHNHRMEPMNEPFLNAKARLAEDARAGMIDRMNDKGRYGASGSVGPKGRDKYVQDLKRETTDLGYDPENMEHLGAVHRVYSAHLPIHDRHYLTGNMGLPDTTSADAHDFLKPKEYTPKNS